MNRDVSKRRALWLADRILPHEPALRAWLHGRLGARMEVDDIVQETYALLAALDDVDHIQNPRAYFFKAAQSVVLQGLRRARIVSIDAVADIDRLSVVPDERSPERYANSHQELRLIGMLLAKLPPKCGEAFALRKVEGLSQREVALRMGVSENTVEKHVGKGLRILLRLFGRNDVGAARSMDEMEARSTSRGRHVKPTP